MSSFPFEIKHPSLSKRKTKIIWKKGKGFFDGEALLPVLEYSQNYHGWNEDLSNIHDRLAGKHPIEVISRKIALKNICDNNKNPKVILEIGCSSGYMIKDLQKNFADSLIIGADVVKNPLYNLSKELGYSVPLMRFDLLKCPLPDNSVDVIVILNVLEHIENDNAAMEQLNRILKPGGVLVSEVPAFQFLFDYYDKELMHFRRYSKKEFELKLSKAHFKIIRTSYIGFLIFPVFTFIKLINKILYKNKKIVQKQSQKTKKSKFLQLLFSLEFEKLINFNLPFGIRIVNVSKKQS